MNPNLTPNIYKRGLDDSGLCNKTEFFSLRLPALISPLSTVTKSQHHMTAVQRHPNERVMLEAPVDITPGSRAAPRPLHWQLQWRSAGLQARVRACRVAQRNRHHCHPAASAPGERHVSALQARRGRSTPSACTTKNNPSPSPTLAHQCGLNHVFFREHSKPRLYN